MITGALPQAAPRRSKELAPIYEAMDIPRWEAARRAYAKTVVLRHGSHVVRLPALVGFLYARLKVRQFRKTRIDYQMPKAETAANGEDNTSGGGFTTSEGRREPWRTAGKGRVQSHLYSLSGALGSRLSWAAGAAQRESARQ